MNNAPTTNDDGLETLTLHFGPTVVLEAALPVASPKMYRAFALVCPKAWGRADWREEVSAVLHPKDLEAAGLTVRDVEVAVEFYTATPASVREVEVHAEPGVFAFVVKADGYRRGPAGG